MGRHEVVCTKMEGQSPSSEMLFGTFAFLPQLSLNLLTSYGLPESEGQVVRLVHAEQESFGVEKGIGRYALSCSRYSPFSPGERFVERSHPDQPERYPMTT